MLENLLNDLRIFDAGNHFDVTAAVFADFNINIEDSLERCIEVMARWRSAGLLSRQLVSRPSDLSGFLPRLAGVT